MQSNIPEKPEYVLINKTELLKFFKAFQSMTKQNVEVFYNNNPVLLEAGQKFDNQMERIINALENMPPAKAEDPKPANTNERFKIKF